MSKLLTFAGVSRLNGELKFRTAADDKRFSQLIKLGDTDVEFVSIQPALSKQAAAQQLLDRNFANGRADVEALLKSVASKKAGEVRVTVPTRFAQERQGKKIKVKKVAESDNIKLTPKQAEQVRAEFMERLRQAYEAN